MAVKKQVDAEEQPHVQHIGDKDNVV